MHKKIPVLITILGLGFILISGTIDLDNFFDYAGQSYPNYINKDNTPTTNQVDNKIATLGRVLFYDKNLSSNNTIACASCHQQAFAFGDPATTSTGLNGGQTGRHSMRLINSRFSDEGKFFWDERATSLEDQTTKPIQDHVEMGFSGTNGDPNFDDLIVKLSAIDYYQTLFDFAYGDTTINEDRIQKALAQFIRSIQSFDAKFDIGRGMVANNGQDFPNFTAQENQGKQLFLNPPNIGGAGCAGCHRPPEFDIDPNSLNNGIISVAGSTTDTDITNTRAPSLRDMVHPNGNLNGPLMHDGSLATLLEVVNHYNAIPNNPANTNLDNRLRMGPNTQTLNLTDDEKNALVAFLGTLTGVDVYTNEIWSDPFDASGNITLVGSVLATEEVLFENTIRVYPNPVETYLNIEIETGDYQAFIYDLNGKKYTQKEMTGNEQWTIGDLSKGIYLLQIVDQNSKKRYQKKFIKK
jgi:cytochrome c peroxidase